MLIVKISEEEELVLPNPVSVDHQKKTHERKCIVVQEGKRQFIKCDQLPAGTLGAELFPYESAAKIEVVGISEVRNLEALAAFIKNKKEGKLPRYREHTTESLLKMLKSVEEVISFATIYDLSSLDLDEREPDSPDIFMVMRAKPKTICLKDAKRFQFAWNQAVLRKTQQ